MALVVIKKSGGLNRGAGIDEVPGDQYIQLTNVWSRPDYSATTGYLGMLSKTPYRGTAYKGTTPAAVRSRGLFEYVKSIASDGTPNNYLLHAGVAGTTYTASDGRLYALDVKNNTWYTLVATGSPYHADFEQRNGRVYMTYGGTIRKWNGDTTGWNDNAPTIANKGGTAVALTGTVTWNGTTAVTGASTAFDTELQEGDYIRKSSTSVLWDEVKTITSATALVLSAASTETGAGSSGASQRAARGSTHDAYTGRFLKIFKDKLFVFSSPTYPSRVWWSSTSQLEDLSATDAGYMDIGLDDGSSGVGMAVLGDYIIFLKDYFYYVYRWSGDVDLPITFIKRFEQGCVSERTICEVEGSIFYFTGSAVRVTSGNQDLLLSGQISYELNTNWKPLASSYFGLTAADNAYPFAEFDPVRGIYHLFLPGTTSGSAYMYDSEKRLWTGTLGVITDGSAEIMHDSTTIPTMVTSTMTSTNQLHSYHRTTLDYSNAATIMSGAMDFGEPTKKKKIYWQEFVFHPKINCSTTLGFNYWDFNETREKPTSGSAREETYALAYAGSSLEYRVRKRFKVLDEVYKYGWCLFETPGGTEGWTLIETTICYDISSTS